MRRAPLLLVISSVLCLSAAAFAAPAGFDAAAAFGSRQDVTDLRLSPDGKNVAFIAPVEHMGTVVRTLSLAPGAKPKIALYASGKPDRVLSCDWVSNDRLVCQIYWIGPHPDLLPFWRMVAVNADGSNLKYLGKPKGYDTYGIEFSGDYVIDWLPEQDGVVLMSRVFLPEGDNTGTRLVNRKFGLAVERVDTRTLASSTIQQPLADAAYFISDGHGSLRIMAERVHGSGGYESGQLRYSFRPKGSDQWQPLCSFNDVEHTGFRPVAVDRDLDVAYGFRKKDGRFALYTMTLDGAARETFVYGRDDVDLDHLIRLGRHQRVVGVSYATDYRKTKYIDESIEKLQASLARALPGRRGIRIVDASVDESKLLVHSSADVDAGVYYLFDRPAKQLQTFLVDRSALENVTLATQKPISFPAKDGVEIPGYLTLPPAKDAKNLPAIVMPHGGPSYRDEWGFDWLPQYFAAQGYAVLQPEFRGSSGYGDTWFQDKGFKSWQTAIGDVLDAGRWLVSEKIADPERLAIVGWSYGGYAALQSVVVDPTLFKAAVAIAPVTDLPSLTEDYRRTTGYFQARDFIGTGPHVHEGSPAENAGKIKVPVLLFHGTEDINVRIYQSQMMDRALTSAGVKHELVTFEGLDHQLDDSVARADMLRRSDAFLRAAFGSSGNGKQ